MRGRDPNRPTPPSFSDVVFDDDRRALRDLQVRAVGLLREPEPFASHDDAVLQHDAVADHDVIANGDLRAHDAVVADARTLTDADVGINNRPAANASPAANRHKWANRNVLTDLGIRRNRRESINASRRTWRVSKERNGACKGEVWLRSVQHGARRGNGCLINDDRGRPCGPERARITGIGKKRQVARLCAVDARHSVHLQLVIAFEPACETLGNLAEFH